MFKSMNFTSQLNRGNFYLSSGSFQIWWLISDMEVMKKDSSISLKLCLLGQKNRDMGCEYNHSYT